jgi:hypothetical protein
MDVIYQGEDWSREVTIQDDADPPNPVDPTTLVATLCPEWPLTVTGPGAPGVYIVSLTREETAALPAPFTTHWEMLGLVGSTARVLVRADIGVVATCVRLEVG